MSSVKAIAIHSDKPWSGGLRKRRYRVTLEDNNAVDRVYVLMPVKVAPADDGTASAAALLQNLTAAEIDQFAAMVASDKDVNQFLDGWWNTQKQLFKEIGFRAMEAEKTDPIVIHFVQYLDQATDNQLRNLFDKSQTWVDRVRGKADKIRVMKTALDDYEPEDMR